MTTPKKTDKPAATKPAKAAKAPKPLKTFDTKAKNVKPMETFGKSINVKLTAKEKDQRNADHTKVWKEIAKLEMDKKIYNDNINAELKAKNADFDELMRAMESGSEDREVRCGLFPVFAKNIVYTVRLDTQEIIGERTMTAEEKLKLSPKKPGTVTKLGVVKDEAQVAADDKAARMKASAVPPETADGGKGHPDDDGLAF